MSLRPARRPVRCSALALLFGAALAAPLAAQWSDDPTMSLSVGDNPGEQTQSKLQPDAAGGVYMSWFDGIGTGFDVRLQLLDASGAESFAHNGVLVADRGFSSTQDYGLSIAADGDALLAFRDDRFTGTQISAARVADDGTLEWGANGVQLTDTTAFVAAPKIAGTADGGAVVAWTQGVFVLLQKLDASGAEVWPAPVQLFPSGGTYSVADLHAHGDDVIVSLVHQTGGFGSPRQLRAQKLDANGDALWGAAPVAVFDSGSLQFGNFPSFEPDGAGGALFSWYDTGSLQLQCKAQRLDSDGTEVFAHNGVELSTNATRIRVSPDASFDPHTGDSVFAWVEQSANQALRGVYAQRLDASGTRLWSDEGVELVPLSSDDHGEVRALTSADTALIFWVETLQVGIDTLHGRRLAANGTALSAEFDVAVGISAKSRVAAATTSHGQSVLAWNNLGQLESDVWAQNVLCDGSLGQPSLSAAWTDLGNALAGTAGLPALAGSGSLCPGSPYSVTLGSARANAPVAAVLGFSVIALPFKGGVLVPAPDLILNAPSTSASGELAIASNWPPSLPAGTQIVVQLWISDPAGPSGFAASNAVQASVP